jgi:hypothetical protein
VGHLGVGDGVDELGAVLDDAALFVAGADHEAGDVLAEQERDTHAVGELDELGALLGLLAEEDPVVGEDPDREAVQRPPPGDEVGAVERFELLEAGPVEDAGEDLAGVERFAQVDRGDAEQVLGVVERRVGGLGRAGAELAVTEPGDDLAGDADGVHLVVGEVIAEAGGAGVHVGAAELLLLRVLAGGHLHERRAAEEHLGAFADEDRVVGHAGDVRAAGRRGPEDHRDGGDAGLRQGGEVVEGAPTGDEDVLLGAQVRTRRLGEVDDREAVLAGDRQAAEGLGDRVRVGRAALDGGIRTADVALDAADAADAGDGGTTRVEVRAVTDQRLELEERAALVEQEREPFADEELVATAVAFDLGGAAAGTGGGERFVELGEEGEVGLAVAPSVVGGRIEPGAEHVGDGGGPLSCGVHVRPSLGESGTIADGTFRFLVGRRAGGLATRPDPRTTLAGRLHRSSCGGPGRPPISGSGHAGAT